MIMKNADGVAVFEKIGTMEKYARGKGYTINGQVSARYKQVEPVKLWVYYRWKNDPELGRLFTCSFSGPENPFPCRKKGELTDVIWGEMIRFLESVGYKKVSESRIRR